ncbi:hypothetical protein GF336_07135 [Candidatus Woesearchaeota archaeon]|nr:hypothetical protein [Candidatus Woesearchaeota archaeon]
MGVSRGLLTIKLLLLFALFWSMISIIFELRSGFFVFEIMLFLLLFVMAVVALMGMGSKWGWKMFIFFYCVNFVNILVIYFMRFSVKEIIFPFVLTGAGYIISLSKSESYEFEEADNIPPVEVVDEEEEKKTASKASSKRSTKKKTSKKETGSKSKPKKKAGSKKKKSSSKK